MADNFDKSAILGSFLDEVDAYIPEIEAHLDQLQQVPDDETSIEEAYRRTHTISGSAAMMDFAGLATIAQSMELILDDALERRAALDQPTIALLRRSCGRLLRVAQLIRSGGSDAQIVAEDQQDHAAYRGGAAGPGAAPSGSGTFTPMPSTITGANGAGMEAMQSTPGAPLPDWLAAFGTGGLGGPSGPSGPSAPLPSVTPQLPDSDALNGANGANGAADPWATSVSSLPTGMTPVAPPPDAYRQASGGYGAVSQPFQPNNPNLPSRPNLPNNPWAQSQAAAQPFAQAAPAQPGQPGQQNWANSMPAAPGWPPAPAAPAASAAPSAASASVVEELRGDEADVRRQVAALRTTVGLLRDAAQAMDDERIELQGFLDGSHDALERLEEWVGQQMGLDLRRSPETVRTYLPLSVIWVTTTRLKKLIALLNTSGRNLTLSQEQIEETLDQFRKTLDSLSGAVGLFGAAGATPDGGFSATVAQVRWAPPAASAPSSEALAPGQRAELERAVRDELRRSLEDEVRREIAAEVRHDEEQRIRQELEVQLRRQMMFSALGPGMGDSSVSVTGAGVEVRKQARRARQAQVTNEQSPEALEVFREEAQEHLQTITTGIADLERSPGDTNAIQAVRRAMHTLKGAAGMMGFVVIQSLAHASEDLLEQLAEHGRALSSEELSLVFDTAETLDQLVSGAIPGQQQQREVAQALIDRYGALTGAPIINLLAEDNREETEESVAINLGADAEENSARANEDLSVRMKLSKLDELINRFGDLLVNRSVFEERIGRIYQLVGDSTQASERLRDVGSQLETQFETFMLPSGQSGVQLRGAPAAPGGFRFPWSNQPRQANNASGGPEHLNDFHELELDRYNEFHRLSRILSEAVTDVLALDHEMETLIREIQVSFARETRLSSEVQDRLLKARLVPVSSLVPRLYRAARASALKEGKEVEFFVEGGDTEVDRKVIEEVEGPLLHLVRNAVNHGIERPEARAAAGKPRAGRITLSAAYEGNQVVINVQDDGDGIDPQRIRQTAIAKGWVDGYSTMSDREALNLIFQQGVSTAETLTDEAGRGVGLDVVRDAALRLRGSVDVDSTPGIGSTFSLRFPISLQIARAVLVKVGPHTYAIPMAVVDQIGRLDYYERVTSPAPAVIVRNERYTLARLSTYLRLPATPLAERSSLLIVNAGRHKVALVVDGIVSQQEIVAKPLGAHLRDVRGVAGATALGNGQVVLILDLLELLAHPIPEAIALPIPGQRDPEPPREPAPPSRSRPASFAESGAGYPQPAPAAPAQWDLPTGAEAQIDKVPTAMLPSAPNLPVVPGAPGGPGAALTPERPPWAMQPTAPPAPQTPGRATLSEQPTAAVLGGQRDFVVAERSAVNSIRPYDAPQSAQGTYLLVVDDSPSVRRVVGGMLKSHGWETQTARDGVEALDVIARERPAAVLLDIEMPRMDGYELMATLRSDPQYRSLPLIVLTSRAAAKHQQRATQLGANAYIVKPYQDEFLLHTIADLVRRSASGAL